jgi:MoxR-like ATPase
MTQTLATVSTSGIIEPAAPVETANKLIALRDELNDLFPERKELVDQLVYAVLIREHVLVFGTFGTGKSHFVNCFFGAFQNASMFSVELTRFMTDANIIGVPNSKILREEGRIFHERAGTMLDARFGELDELFDANPPVLRTLLGILNERRFNRGVQHERALLHTAMASTNADPRMEVKRYPELGAVVDRFLLQTEVKYLEQPESRRRMLANYLARRRPSIQIEYTDLEALADAVAAVPIADPVFIDLHEQILTGARSIRPKEDGPISDRRACQAFKLVQAHAMLYGRDEALPEDFMETRWAYCFDDDPAAHDRFKKMADPIIDKVVKERQPDVVATQLKLLGEYAAKLPKIDRRRKPEPDELVTMNRTIVGLLDDVRAVQPSHVSIEDRKKVLLKEIEAAKENVGKLIDGKTV